MRRSLTSVALFQFVLLTFSTGQSMAIPSLVPVLKFHCISGDLSPNKVLKIIDGTDVKWESVDQSIKSRTAFDSETPAYLFFDLLDYQRDDRNGNRHLLGLEKGLFLGNNGKTRIEYKGQLISTYDCLRSED